MAEEEEEGYTLADVRVAAWAMRWLIAVNVLFWFANVFNTDVGLSYLRTLVKCNSTDPPYPHSSGNWSGSAACTNRATVLGEATQHQGTLLLLSTFVNLVALFVLGPLVDHPCFGRKKSLVLAMSGVTIGLFLLWINGYAGGLKLVYLSFIISALLNNFPASSAAMAADLCSSSTTAENSQLTAQQISAKNPRIVGMYMSIYSAASAFGEVTGLAIGYYVLTLDLSNYKSVWLGFMVYIALSTIFAALFLSETLPKSPVGGDAPTGKCGDSHELFRGIVVIHNDWFLRGLALVTLLLSTATWGTLAILTPFQISVLRYTQSQAARIYIVAVLGMMIGYSCNTAVQKILGPFVTLQLALACLTISVLCVGLLAPFYVAAFWVFIILLGVEFGLIIPCYLAIVSVRISSVDQGRAQTVFLQIVSVSKGIGGYIWLKKLFHAAEDYREGAGHNNTGYPFVISAVLLGIAWIVYSIMLRFVDTSMEAQSARARQPSIDDSKQIRNTEMTEVDSASHQGGFEYKIMD